MEVNFSAFYLQLKGLQQNLSTNTSICLNYLLKIGIDIVLTSAVTKKGIVVPLQVTKI